MSVESLKSIFDIATVVLLFLTFLARAGVLITGNIINNRQAQQLREFETDIALANQKAAEATQTAESERLARVQLEESMAWRRLSEMQETAIEDELKNFSVMRTWLLYNLNYLEAAGFAAGLAKALAKWNPAEPEPIMKMAEGPVPIGTNGPPARGVFVSTTGQESENKEGRRIG